MNSKEILLAGLRDIREPPTPVDTFLTPIVVLTALLGLLLLCLATLLLFQSRAKRGGGWLKSSLTELDHIRQQISSDRQRKNSADVTVHLARLLRQHVTHVQPVRERHQVAKLDGQQWLEFLDTTFSTTWFTHSEGRAFGNQLYTAEQIVDTTTLLSICDQLKLFFKDHYQRTTWQARRIHKRNFLSGAHKSGKALS